MKKCPQCQRTFSDETLSFCLEDGALLSAPFDPKETNTPTVALSAEEIPTVAAKEISPVVNPPGIIEQTERTSVRWYIYLLGFVISLIISQPLRILYFRDFEIDNKASFFELALDVTDDSQMMLYIGVLFAILVFFTPIYAIIALVLGFVWSEAKWKWGLIVVIPVFLHAFYLFIYYLPVADFKNLFVTFIIWLIAAIILAFIAGLFSYSGSRLRTYLKSRNAK